ncbi:hypothetical protein [Paenibacillus sp. S150]|uniref:hypothetical protein n=1 Tax=Paenibacillus sp. S150 TaxID=2749826 RepID=UPI001C5A1EBD|nr:hypothetical protein [Paenibacillus sp. S150]MBW4083866.1 hypothetical protein [Paenibacillus sp. S150]
MSTSEEHISVFGKKQIRESALFPPKEKDVLDAVLQENQGYTLNEAKQLIKLFLTKEVI